MTDEERHQVIAALEDAQEHCPKNCCFGNITAALVIMRMDRVPVAWAMPRPDGRVLDVICPDEHESYAGEYSIPLYKD